MPTPKSIEKVKGEFASEVATMLKAGQEIHIPGLGKFEKLAKPARTGRNPATGEPVQIAAKNAVRYVAAKSLKDAINA